MTAGSVRTRSVEREQTASRPRLSLSGLVVLPAVVFVLFVAVPLGALVLRAAQSGQLLESLAQPAIHDALRLSLITSLLTAAIVVLLGTPLAYLLARRQFPGKALIDTLVDLPMVLPPVVAGVALLMAFGRRGVFGPALEGAGLDVAFTAKAVVAAQVFVSSPFYVRAARVGFQAVDETLEQAAAIDGASPWRSFLHITLPLSLPALLSGIVLCWARALSEFGATMMFAGNLRGTTQTMSLAIMTAMESNLYTALAMSVVLLAVACATLLAFRALTRQGLRL
ncbi:MAG TPA: ABC transporter permease [Dehalococcoidia bacterium]|nr:ABC transporter permease [Dehalococcoidia bacterium]